MSGWAALFNNTQSMIRYQTREMTRLQEMAGTGSRINRPSDAPADAFRILQFRAESATMEKYTRNLSSVTDAREISATVLQGVSDALSTVRTLAAQAASGTYTQENRDAGARVIEAALEQVVSLVNTSHSGRYLFGGGATDTPYTVESDGHWITQVNYEGGAQTLSVPVANGVEYGTVMVGDAVLRGDDRRSPEFFGNTGVRAGDGTSNTRGDAWLLVTHTSTVYQGGSGIVAGDTSAAEDTVIGTRHTLTVDEPNHRLRLDDGEYVTFTGAETNLAVRNEGGDVVHVNVQGVAPGFSDTVAITGNGTLSLDDGATTTPITFGSNDAVTDSRTGRILYVNTAEMNRSGIDPVRVHGTFDLFSAIISVRDAILNKGNQSESDQMASLDDAMGALTDVIGYVNQAATSNGAQLQAMSTLKENLTQLKSITDGQASSLEEADIVDVASDLARRQVLYQMTLATVARLLSLSILDYL